MRSYIAIALTAGIFGCLGAACSAGEFAEADGGNFGGNDYTTGSGGAGDDAGYDVMVGDDGGRTDPFTYANYCGGGCSPAAGEPSDPACMLEGGGGAGGSSMVEGDCSLVIGDNGTVNGECTLKDPMGTDTAPCFTAENCAPGFACVGENKCRAYCCGDVEACPSGTYCALVEPASADVPDNVVPPQLPVCELADQCMLFDANGSGCSDGKVCSIVRADGTTSCIDPGIGAAGDSCPCQEGFVCSYAKNKCFEICSLLNDECPSGYVCQAQGYPQDVGICVSQ